MEAAAAVSSPPVPLRRRSLSEEVRQRIARDYVLNDAVAAGQLLPSETELSSRYGVSRVTVRSGLQSLHDAGLITARHGVGWMVLTRSRALTQGLDSLASLETFAKEAGQEIGTAQLEWEELAADAELAGRLHVPFGHSVLAVRRVKTLGGVAVAWIADYVPGGVLPFDRLREEFAGSVLDVLLAHSEVGVEYEDTNIEPVNLPDAIAAKLAAGPGDAALHMNGATWTSRGTVAEYGESWLLPQFFSFSVRRRRPVGH